MCPFLNFLTLSYSILTQPELNDHKSLSFNLMASLMKSPITLNFKYVQFKQLIEKVVFQKQKVF